MNRTKIGYCDFTWNPVTGCTFGCDWCFARSIAQRFCSDPMGRACELAIQESEHADRHGEADAGQVFPFGFHPTTYPHRLAEPLKVKKPSVVFACDMGDLFGPEIPDEFRDRVFTTMAAAQWPAREHTFLLLTKRAAEMQRYLASVKDGAFSNGFKTAPWPMPNVYLGVSVTNQADADERIPILLDTPAAHRWLSCEPLLGPIGPFVVTPDLDFLVVGPLTGPKAVRWHREHPCEACEGHGGWLRQDHSHSQWSRDSVLLCPVCGGGFGSGQWTGGHRGRLSGRAADAWCDDAIRQALTAGVPCYDKRDSYAIREEEE